MFRIFIFFCFVHLANVINAQKISIEIQADAAHFVENKDSVLTYQIAEKSLNGTYRRSNYIHPLYSLDGQILTEDFPKDHLHHRGIFWAWHQMYIGDTQLGDAWDIKDFSWDVKSVKEVQVEGKAKAIQAEVFWKTSQWKDDQGNEKPVVREVTTIKVYPVENQYRKIDVEIAIRALESHMRIGGSENEKGYGGFSTRVRLVNDIEFTSSSGETRPQNLPVEAGNWMDISGSFGKGGALSGMSILCHPDNPGFSDRWILRSEKSMQNAVYPYPGAIAVPISETQPTVLRYRLIIHEGGSEFLDIESEHAEYGKQ